jgi:predicted ester cyclase
MFLQCDPLPPKYARFNEPPERASCAIMSFLGVTRACTYGRKIIFPQSMATQESRTTSRQYRDRRDRRDFMARLQFGKSFEAKPGRTSFMSIRETAAKFSDACDRGEGWEVCKAWCHDGATFACQSDALADAKSLKDYTEWAKGLLTPLPDAHYELKAIAADPEKNSVLVFAVFKGTHTGDGGPTAPTGKSLAADYVYAIEFDSDKIRHMTKIWNDAHSLRSLGWA